MDLKETDWGGAWYGLIWLRTEADKDGNKPFTFLDYRLKKYPCSMQFVGKRSY